MLLKNQNVNHGLSESGSTKLKVNPWGYGLWAL